MNKRLFIDVHAIQTVPPSCVNRDDTGSPKTATYGGVRRARVSSQSWKKAIRTSFQNNFDEKGLGIRTKKITELVADEIRKIDPNASDAMGMAVKVISAAGIKLEADSKKKDEDAIPETKALFFISAKQAENLARLACSDTYGKKEVQAALNSEHGIDIALFGRMVADDPSLNADASAQVAHAISTHKVDNEYDYFTAVDDRSPEDNAGAGMIGTVEFNSSTLYRYATVAIHDLFNQLSEDAEATSNAVGEFIRAFVSSMPTGKQNTFANRTVPNAVLVCIREDQPVNLVGAFETPIMPDQNSGGYVKKSIDALERYEHEVCSSFVPEPIISWHVGEGLNSFGDALDLKSMIERLEDYVRGKL
ncbi:type I-E CRISPR-associated protein Cas7/Cse4/CasC [Candidatus Methanomassiliicoccus intestinalis]|uniref:type I-E CRISPR-associated protein Cas7/Cse4/CasC n=1 Tax=Candidatus Methanomassiliicoccus intestinalis TaxID=1406512 RepID=UPI0037DDCC18